MKIGRNDKCWCGSGLKFKKCHYGREEKSPISKGDAFDHSKKNASRSYCSVANEMKHECSANIINAHTISKSSSLIEIADKSNHVLGLNINLGNIAKHEGKLIPERIGVNKASTFKGFCSVHDKALFACIEDREFVGDEEQCLALMYRSVAKELYAKDGALKTSEFIKDADKGKQPMDQMLIQTFAADYQLGLKTSIKELSELKSQLDDQLLDNSTNNLSHVIIESSSPMPVAVSSIVSPTYDFEGNLIQDLGDLSVAAESMVFNSFSSDGKGYVVFSWLKKSSKVFDFVNTLLAIKQTDIFSSLIRFFFGFAENNFISPSWWEGLSVAQRGKIENLIMSGVNPVAFEPDKLLIDDGIQFIGWKIDTITNVNF